MGMLRWVVLSLALPAAAFAQYVQTGNSLNPVGSGARALGQGNAFIAVADDATAASWNPGGLSQLERPEASFAAEWLSGEGDIYSRFMPSSEHDAHVDVRDLNYASIAYPFQAAGHNTVLSLNYLKQYRFDRDMTFPIYIDDGAGFIVTPRYHMNQTGSFSTLSPAVGIDVTDKLALGLAFNIWNDSITGASSYRKTEKEVGHVDWLGFTADYSSNTENEYTVDKGYSLTLGGMYRLTRQWTVGAVFKPAYRLSIDHRFKNVYEQTGTLGVQLPTTFTTRETEDLYFPMVLGAGVAYRPTDPLTVSFDATWTDWSNFVYDTGPRENNPLSGNPLYTDECKDTMTYRVGAEYLIVRKKFTVPLRCGFQYDPGPAVDGADQYCAVTLGTGIQTGRIAFDVAYEYRWGDGVNAYVYPATWSSSENVTEHRVMASMIVYF